MPELRNETYIISVFVYLRRSLVKIRALHSRPPGLVRETVPNRAEQLERSGHERLIYT